MQELVSFGSRYISSHQDEKRRFVPTQIDQVGVIVCKLVISHLIGDQDEFQAVHVLNSRKETEE